MGYGAVVPPNTEVNLPEDIAVGPASEVEAPPDDRLAGEAPLGPAIEVELLTG